MSGNNIFDNKEHLKFIVREYSKNIFTAGDIISDEMIEFIFETFIDDEYAPFGRVLGHIEKGSIVYDRLDEYELETHEIQTNKLNEFIGLFIRNFSNDSISDPGPVMDADTKKGTYGAVVELEKVLKNTPENKEYASGKYAKFMLNTKSDSPKNMNMANSVVTEDRRTRYGTGYFRLSTDINLSVYAWMLEFCTFVIIMSVFGYIDCNLLVDTDRRKQCMLNKYENIFETINEEGNTTYDYFFSYRSFMANLEKPFITKIDGTPNYLIGYIMIGYVDTLHRFYNKIIKIAKNAMDETDDNGLKKREGPELTNYLKHLLIKNAEESVTAATDLTIQTIEIFERLTDLENIGVIVSHRDISTNNIMYTRDRFYSQTLKIKIIDFGFMCTRINYKDGAVSFVGGYFSECVHPDAYPHESGETLRKVCICDNPHYDIVYFVICLLRNYGGLFNIMTKMLETTVFERFNMLSELANIVGFNQTAKKIIYELNSKKSNYLFAQWEAVLAVMEENRRAYEEGILPKNKLLQGNIYEKLYDLFTPLTRILNRETQKYTPYADYGNMSTYRLDVLTRNNNDNNSLNAFIQEHESHKQAYVDLKNEEKHETLRQSTPSPMKKTPTRPPLHSLADENASYYRHKSESHSSQQNDSDSRQQRTSGLRNPRQRSPRQRSSRQRSPRQRSPRQRSPRQRSSRQRSPKQRNPEQQIFRQRSPEQRYFEQKDPEQNDRVDRQLILSHNISEKPHDEKVLSYDDRVLPSDSLSDNAF